jgi:hypothetical protein
MTTPDLSKCRESPRTTSVDVTKANSSDVDLDAPSDDGSARKGDGTPRTPSSHPEMRD